MTSVIPLLNVWSEIDERSQEAYIRQEYEDGDISEFDWGTVKLDIDGADYKNYQMAVFAWKNELPFCKTI